MNEEQPYIVKELVEVKITRCYNPKYGDSRMCECGHTYARHFDPYENMATVGCKYCNCYDFKEQK